MIVTKELLVQQLKNNPVWFGKALVVIHKNFVGGTLPTNVVVPDQKASQLRYAHDLVTSGRVLTGSASNLPLFDMLSSPSFVDYLFDEIAKKYPDKVVKA